MQGLLDFLSQLFTPLDRWVWRYSIGVSDRYYRDGSNGATIQRFGTLLRIATRLKTLRHMRLVLGEETRNEAEWKRLWDAYAHEVAQNLMEMVMLSKLPNARLSGMIELKGEHYLREALERKRGAMLFLSHLGAMATVAAALGPRGYDVTLAGNVMPRPYFEEKLRDVFLERGVKRLLLGDNLPFRAAEIFRRNAIFATFFDHAIGPKHNVWVPFGRAETSISLGPAIMALRCQAPIFPVSHRRLDTYRYEIEIGPPIAAQGESLHDKARAVMQHAMAWLARDLVGRPEQWWPWDFAVIRPAVAPALETSAPVRSAQGLAAPRTPSHNALGFGIISGLYRLRETLIRRWGEDSRPKVTGAMVRFFYRPLSRRRFKHMHLALRLTRGEFRAVESAHLQYLTLFETKAVWNSHSTPEEIKARVSLEGEDHLQEALKLGKGVFLIGGHLGIWSHARLLLSSLGYPVLNVMADLPVAYHQELTKREQRHFGLQCALVGQGASKRIDEALSHNKIVSCCCDLPYRLDRRVGARFGAAELLVDPGTAKLLLRYSAPILRTSCSAHPSGRDVVRISPPVSRPADADPEAAIRRLTGDLIDHLYQDIQTRPAEWFGWSYIDLKAPRVEPSPV